MKIEHVKKTKEYQDVLVNGNKWPGKLICLYCKQLESREQPFVRIGTVITKKLAPAATQRNHVKRVIYGFFNDHRNFLATGNINVVRLSKNLKDIPKRLLATEIREELERLSAQAGILK